MSEGLLDSCRVLLFFQNVAFFILELSIHAATMAGPESQERELRICSAWMDTNSLWGEEK